MHSSEGSPEVEPVPLPGSSGEQRITKDQKRKKRKAEETERSRDEDQGSARTPTRPEDAARERERERFSTSVLGKKPFCLGCIIQYSENTDRFCLQKQKCFIIRGLFLSADSKNSDSKSYCKLLLPDIFVLLQLVPKFPAENLKF